MRWAVTVTALWLCALPSALAQSEDWLVLPTTIDSADPSWMEPTIEAANRALRRQGIGVWFPDAAAAAFRDRGSFEAPAPSQESIDAWAERARSAFRTVVLGDRSVARSELEAVQSFAEENLVFLNRTPETAGLVLDVCLYLARAYRDAGDLDRSDQQVRDCIRLAPEATPNPRVHPPSLVDAYEAARKPGPARAGALIVESEPRGCELRVNGAFVGETPTALEGLYPGSYQVQVECRPGDPGRVHRIEVPARPESLFVIDPFERVVRSDAMLYLEFKNEPEPAELARYAREVARPLPASAVVIASLVAADSLQLEVELATQTESSFVRLPLSQAASDQDLMNRAVESLLAGRCADFSEGILQEIDCRTGELIAPPSVEGTVSKRVAPRGLFVAGVTAASVGTASLAAGWSLFFARRSVGNDWVSDANNLSVQARWLDLGKALAITGPVGGGLLVASMPMVLPIHAKTPWWAWLNGGLGVAAAVGSIVSGVTAAPKPPESCEVNGQDPTACVDRGRDVNRAVLLGATAAPLLTMPLVYLLRRDERKPRVDVEPRALVGRRGGFVGVTGSF